MKYAIISDIHANLQALEAVLSDIPNDITIVHLGDLVGYGAKPNEVIELLSETAGVRGNHDVAVLGDPDLLENFNDEARASALWTTDILTTASREYLQNLPYVGLINDEQVPFTLVHGSPYEPCEFHYIFDNQSAMRATKHFSTQVCFVGHSHFPVSFARANGSGTIVGERHGLDATSIPKLNGKRLILEDTLSLEDGVQYVINVGSVGQPRDSNPDASYALFDTTTRTITWRRLSYDVAGAQADIESAGLPLRNSVRLGIGI